MFVDMRITLGLTTGSYRAGVTYLVDDSTGAEWVRKRLARETKTPPRYIQDLLARLDDGADRPCLFLPFVGEFGHEVMTHLRIVHFHRARVKVVCCRPGNEVLYPSADDYVTDWSDPTDEAERIGTMRDAPIQWPQITCQFPAHHAVAAGVLSPDQELWAIQPETRIPFRPLRRGIRVDVVLGVRHRALFPERNWPHWQWLADALTAAGLTFAVVGRRPSTLDLRGQIVHTGDFDTDLAIELMETCKLYVGTDSGGSHLASTVGAPMLIFRETASASRDLTKRMEQVNPGRVDVVAGGWTKPDRVVSRMLSVLGKAVT